MIVNPYVGMAGFRGFAGAWEDWCDQNYYTPENNEKCKNCNRINIPILGPKCTFPDPKTIAGRLARGLPQQTDLERLGPQTQPDTSAPANGGIVPPTSGDQLIPGIPNVALGLGAALFGGGLFYMMSKKGGRR